MIAPVMPHLAEEIWERIGGEYSVHNQRWPQYDEALAADEVITLVVQINGKVRGRLEVPVDIDEASAKETALKMLTSRNISKAKRSSNLSMYPDV
jgi:leucyl-tRNA synthetase